MSFPLRLLFMALITCALLSCSTPAEESAGPVEMKFTVVDAYLGPQSSMENPALTLSPPKGWQALDSARVASLQVPNGKTFRLEPRMVFMDSTTGCVLIVTAWYTDSTLAWAEMEARQRQEVDLAGSGRSVKHDHFILAGQDCLQSMVQDSVMVNFKLFLAKGAQLDYVVPAQVYASQAERIESSLGSLTFSNGSTQTTGETP